MSNELVVYKKRRNEVVVRLGVDISADTFASQIRTHPDLASQLLATWTTSFVTDGEDGELLLTLTAAEVNALKVDAGYMDLKRITGGEPIPVFDLPLPVVFRTPVTE